MNVRIAAIGALICLGTSTAMAKTDDRSDIQALFYRVARAMSAKDAGGVMALGTADMTYVEKGKILSGGQIASHMQKRFRLMQGSPQCRIQLLSLEVKGKIASALTSDYTAAEVSGSGARSHRVVVTGRSREELVKGKRGWLLKSIYVITDNMTMDGRQLGSSALGG